MARGRPSGVCNHCGEWAPSLEMDHVVPTFAGGAHDTGNLQWLCVTCHDLKTGSEWHERPNKGPFSKEGAAALRATGWDPRKGTRHSEESRAKMSAAWHAYYEAHPEKNAELRANGRKGALALWGDPTRRAKHSASMRESWSARRAEKVV